MIILLYCVQFSHVKDFLWQYAGVFGVLLSSEGFTYNAKNLICQPPLFQDGFVKGHRRTPSDAEFRELTLRDARESLHKELEKLIQTSKPELRSVSVSGTIRHVRGISKGPTLLSGAQISILRFLLSCLQNQGQKMLHVYVPVYSSFIHRRFIIFSLCKIKMKQNQSLILLLLYLSYLSMWMM